MAVVEFLLKKLPNYCENDNICLVKEYVARNNGIDIVNVPSLLLNQLRWLDFISDPLSVANQLLDMASVMQFPVSIVLFVYFYKVSYWYMHMYQ